MDSMILTKTRLFQGVWEGVLISKEQPSLVATHLNKPMHGLELTKTEEGKWSVRLPIPAELIGDGMQTFIISDSKTGQSLASFAFLGGDALAEDIRAEVDLLRAELDMLKRAFRRHCVETA